MSASFHAKNNAFAHIFVTSRTKHGTMKKNCFIYVLAVAAVMSVCSCGGKKESDGQVPQTDTAFTQVANSGIVEEESLGTCDTVDWQGGKAFVKITRKPDADGGTVKDENGVEYRNNVITLQIIKNGNTVVDKQFRKSDFRGYIDDVFYNKYVLEGLVYDKTQGGTIILGASVANPIQEDEYIPFKVNVSANGNVSVAKDNEFDVIAPEESGD